MRFKAHSTWMLRRISMWFINTKRHLDRRTWKKKIWEREREKKRNYEYQPRGLFFRRSNSIELIEKRIYICTYIYVRPMRVIRCIDFIHERIQRSLLWIDLSLSFSLSIELVSYEENNRDFTNGSKTYP